jgi:hypothetical protein
VEISIEKESPRCQGCNIPFEHDQKHLSLLRIKEKSFLREDYCEKCWSERGELADSNEVYSYWETRYRDPAVAKATPQEQFVPLLNLCYESIARGDSEGEAMAYMSALVLRRQKIFRFLREDKEDSTGREILVFSDRHNDTQVRICDPKLTESQLQDVKHRLEELLGQPRGQVDDQQSGSV